jgi:glutathione synthase/RimK-type ligase-like ATP-grasp enzyme
MGVARVGVVCCRRERNAAASDLYPDPDAEPLQRSLAEVGAVGILVAWDDSSVSWDSFEQVVISSTWDSVDRPAEYLEWADTVSSKTVLVNAAPVLAWGLDKAHQKNLAAAGIAVIPTLWVPRNEQWEPPAGEFVVKPAVSAGGRSTVRYRPGDTAAAQAHVAALHDAGQTVMVQPYWASIDQTGEVDVVYLAGRYSHAVRKLPALQPGRGIVERPWEQMAWSGPVTPSAEQLAVADAVFARIEVSAGVQPLYARVDLLDGTDGPALLEVEVVDPYLSLDTFPDTARDLARAIIEA